MFQNLQRGSQIYILHMGMTPYYEAGVVETTSNLPTMPYYPAMPMMPLDISVRVGESVIPYKQIPPTAEIAKVASQTSGEQVCIACSKEALNKEVEMLIQNSVDSINSVEMHKRRIETCRNLLNQLNPEKVREAQQAQEINELKGQLADMKAMMHELTAQLKSSGASSTKK